MLALLAAFDGVLAVAAAARPGALSAVAWVQVLAALVLIANLALIPRPMPADPLLPRFWARAALLVGTLAGAALAAVSALGAGGH